jgi:hypothetical protein
MAITVMRRMGASQFGLVAMSEKVFFGLNKTPTILANIPIAGTGASGAGVAVIVAILNSSTT